MNLYTNIHSSIKHNSQKVEKNQNAYHLMFICSTDGWTDKQNVLYPYNGILFHSKNRLNEVLIHATTWILLNVKNLSQKATYYVIPFKQSAQSRQIHAGRK